jgi:hypothetical protein
MALQCEKIAIESSLPDRPQKRSAQSMKTTRKNILKEIVDYDNTDTATLVKTSKPLRLVR